MGIEPMTDGSAIHYSTTELPTLVDDSVRSIQLHSLDLIQYSTADFRR